MLRDPRPPRGPRERLRSNFEGLVSLVSLVSLVVLVSQISIEMSESIIDELSDYAHEKLHLPADSDRKWSALFGFRKDTYATLLEKYDPEMGHELSFTMPFFFFLKNNPSWDVLMTQFPDISNYNAVSALMKANTSWLSTMDEVPFNTPPAFSFYNFLFSSSLYLIFVKFLKRGGKNSFPVLNWNSKQRLSFLTSVRSSEMGPRTFASLFFIIIQFIIFSLIHYFRK